MKDYREYCPFVVNDLTSIMTRISRSGKTTRHQYIGLENVVTQEVNSSAMLHVQIHSQL